MRNTLSRNCFVTFVLVASAVAQSHFQTEPSPAVSGPAYEMSAGYSNISMPIPGASRVNLNGLDLSGGVDLNPRWGLTLDSNYVRTSDIAGTPHPGYVLTVLGGPTLYLVEHGSTRMFIHGLAGQGLIDGAVPESDDHYRYGWHEQFAYAAGGGFEHALTGSFALRVSGDYLRTSFFDAAGAMQPQNNLRLTISGVFRLRDRQHKVAAP
jgi:opacity protein-like surface antigen